MRRIRDRGEAENMQNAQEAYDNYSRNKHKRICIRKYDEKLEKKSQSCATRTKR